MRSSIFYNDAVEDIRARLNGSAVRGAPFGHVSRPLDGNLLTLLLIARALGKTARRKWYKLHFNRHPSRHLGRRTDDLLLEKRASISARI
jgi:hypothetical protein